MKIFVVVPTLGRAAITSQTVDWLAGQSRLPDGVLVVGVGPDDVLGVKEARLPVEISFAERGSCRQRNHALDLLAGRADMIIILDDDYLPAHDFIAQAEAFFTERPEIVGATGRLIADGIHNHGYGFAEAVKLVEDDKPPAPFELPREALYGCNMVIRTASAAGLRFDENLPLYGWQEDIDFTYQLGQRGPMALTSRLAGVHMGTRTGRTPGKRLGYSQIANPLYLLRKKTMPRAMAFRLMYRNVIANLVKSLKPEAHIDRRGRLAGNLLAARDLLIGKLSPSRILDLT